MESFESEDINGDLDQKGQVHVGQLCHSFGDHEEML